MKSRKPKPNSSGLKGRKKPACVRKRITKSKTSTKTNAAPNKNGNRKNRRSKKSPNTTRRLTLPGRRKPPSRSTAQAQSQRPIDHCHGQRAQAHTPPKQPSLKRIRLRCTLAPRRRRLRRKASRHRRRQQHPCWKRPNPPAKIRRAPVNRASLKRRLRHNRCPHLRQPGKNRRHGISSPPLQRPQACQRRWTLIHIPP